MATKYTSYVFDPVTGQYVKISTSSGGSGVNYETLENAPIQIANGANESSFVNISGLDYGNYSVNGYYKFDVMSDLLHTSSEAMMVTVTKDIETGKKVAIYETSENYKVVTHIVVYDGSLIEKIINQGPGTYWNSI